MNGRAIPRRAAKPPRDARPRRKVRRALTNVTGTIDVCGDANVARVLKRAFEQAANVERESLTHSFHSYPARMHPQIARVVLDEVGSNGRVLDPFCGSGTVLLEAMVRGQAAVGLDLNPLALRISEVKCARRSETDRQRFLETLESVGESSRALIRRRAPSRAPLGSEQRSWYTIHVLKELSGLLDSIRAVRDDFDRRALEVLFSAIAIKFSNRKADTSEQRQARQIRKGLPTDFFVRKGRELVLGWSQIARAIPTETPPLRLVEADARTLPEHFDAGSIDCVLSSPPYGGTYDYVDHHRLRLDWLGLSAKALSRSEIGARRRFSKPTQVGNWDRELDAMLSAMSAVVKNGGHVCLLMGDAQIGPKRIDALRQLKRLGAKRSLEFIAAASADRPDFTRRTNRNEHLVLFRRG